jgi:hypothetical protein
LDDARRIHALYLSEIFDLSYFGDCLLCVKPVLGLSACRPEQPKTLPIAQRRRTHADEPCDLTDTKQRGLINAFPFASHLILVNGPSILRESRFD